MRFLVAAAVLALSVPAACFAAPANPPAPAAPVLTGTPVDDAQCVVAFYFVTITHKMTPNVFSDEGAKAARDGFLYYSGRLSSRTDDAALRAAVTEALKNKDADVKTVAEACLRRMGERLMKTEEVADEAMNDAK